MCCTCLVMEPYVPASARRDIVHEECVSAFITASLAAFEELSFAAPTPTPVVITLTVRRGLSIGFATSPDSSELRCASYAIMSNHLHLVLRNRPDRVEQWSDAEVALRWRKLFPQRTTLRASQQSPTTLTWRCSWPTLTGWRPARPAVESVVVHEVLVRMGRPRGQSRGESAGRFWAGRFKSQPLLDEAALLACSVYVDLNPIRAGIASYAGGIAIHVGV